MYKITKQFIGGLLKGLTITEFTNIKFNTGFVCNKPIAGSPYKIINIEEV